MTPPKAQPTVHVDQAKIDAYEAKLEAKRDRYADMAASKARESRQRFETVDGIARMIPMGQPILVGHHSEKRHRRDLERMHNGMRKGFEAKEASEHYAEKARSYGTYSVSADDPAAILKLRAELEPLEKLQATMKAVNAIVRKKKLGKEEKIALIAQVDGMTPETAARAMEPDCFNCLGFARYRLSNNNANIRRLKQRIDELLVVHSSEVGKPIEGDGYRIEEDKDDNRVRIFFDAIPGEDVRKYLKSNGWRWSRTNKAWQRYAHTGGYVIAKQFHKWITATTQGTKL